VAVLQDVLDVCAIPPELQIIHSPPEDGPGRTVFRRGVPQPEATLEARERLASYPQQSALPTLPDEAL
jgi:hypothetical protein